MEHRIAAGPEIVAIPGPSIVPDRVLAAWTGRAVVLEGPVAKPVIGAVKRKYGWQVTLIDVASAVRSLVTRRPSVDAAVVITPD